MALAELLQEKVIDSQGFKVILRATGHDELHRQAIDEFGLGEIVFLEPSVDYESALAEMLVVDGLLVFQATNCNHQIPAKIYEYLRAKRPILALTDPEGDTARVLSESGISSIVPLNDKVAIAKLIASFVNNSGQKSVAIASDEAIAAHSRQACTERLAKLLAVVS
jgi:hypothetical protein